MTSTTSPTPVTVQVTAKPGSQVELRVEAPPQAFEAAIVTALQHIGRRLRIPGFRPGKAPAPVVERTVGWEAVKQEAIEHLVPELYVQALDQEQIDPVGEPEWNLVTIERNEPVVFSATVTVKPTVDLGDYTSLRVPIEPAEVTDEQLDTTIENVRRQYSELVDVERPCQAGDTVRAVLTMRNGDEVLSGGDGEERDLELDRDALLPGLTDGIVGMTAGEERSFPLKLPDDFGREELRGVEVAVTVSIAGVKERVMPPLDDTLAERDGHGTTLDELRQHYRDALVKAAQDQESQRYESAVLEALRDRASVDIPEVMIDQQVDREVRDMEYRLSSMGMQFEKYLEYTKSSIPQFRGERRADAGLRVKMELVLDAIASHESIEVDETAVEQEAKLLTEGRKMDARQRRRAHDLTRTDLRRRAAVNRILEIARS